MQMTSVNSSMIESVGYDQEARLLAAKFKSNGAVYHAYDVPPHVHADLMASSSVGQFWNKHIQGAFTVRKQA